MKLPVMPIAKKKKKKDASIVTEIKLYLEEGVETILYLQSFYSISE